MDLIGPAVCFLGAAAVAINFNVPRRAIVTCGLLGNTAWFSQVGLVDAGFSMLASNFVAAFIVALLSEAMARFHRLPVTCLAVPGVIPLVPGFAAYNAMYGYVGEEYAKANAALLQSVLIAGAISAALATGGSIVNFLPGQSPWRNPQSPIDDEVLTCDAMEALTGAASPAPRAAAPTPPAGSD